MAARVNKIRHDDETRAKIQTSQLINRLQSYVLGEVQLEPGQVTAALGLMKKTLPDLTATEHSGDMTLRHEDALEQLDKPAEGNPPEAAE